MTQIIVVDSNETFTSLLHLNITKCIGSNVIIKTNSKEALEYLEEHPNINLIISRDHIDEDHTASQLINSLVDKKLKIPVIILGGRSLTYPEAHVLSSAATWRETIFKAGTLLGVEVDFEKNVQKIKYTPVGINHFLNLDEVNICCDVYIRVKKGEEFHYIKRFHAEETLSREVISKYKSSGLTMFYINRDQFREFVDFSTKQLSLKLKNEKISATERAHLNSDSHNVMAERIQCLGIDQHTTELVEASIASTKVALVEKNALSAYLERIQTNKLSYGYSHSYMCCLILHKISKSFDWCTTQVKEKFTLISLFHDISLSEELVVYNNADDLKFSDLDNYDKTLVTNHAQLSATIISAFDFIPEEVASVIREHHGAKNGIGFPDNLSISISTIAMMFVVVEDFVDQFLSFEKNPTESEMKDLLEKLKAKYTKLTYEKTISAICEMVYSK